MKNGLCLQPVGQTDQIVTFPFPMKILANLEDVCFHLHSFSSLKVFVEIIFLWNMNGETYYNQKECKGSIHEVHIPMETEFRIVSGNSYKRKCEVVFKEHSNLGM